MDPFRPWRALGGFFRRDLTIHTSYKLGFSMDLAGVFFNAATYYFIARLIGQAATPWLGRYGGDYFSFALIGVAFSSYQNVGLNSFSQSLRQEQFLNTLEPLLMTPVTIPQFLVGSALWDFLYSTLEVALYLALGALFFGFRPNHAHPGAALAVLALTLLAFMGLGIFSAAFIMKFKRGNPVTWLIISISQLLGGVYFPTEILPASLRTVSLAVPMTPALSGLRKTMLAGGGWGDIRGELTALALFVVVLWPLGTLLFASALRRARADGSLGHY
jgi:ABC-2 type transport system permease protein